VFSVIPVVIPIIMRKLLENQEEYKPRTIKLSDKNWEEFLKLKPRDKTWELFIKELLETINYFKNL
jgi:hypothetical protein